VDGKVHAVISVRRILAVFTALVRNRTNVSVKVAGAAFCAI